MKLSVVIVNYNVKYFLEQCLRSVVQAMDDIEGEIWVVDNNSTDGSVTMVRENFPEVNLIANSDNPGFAKANNQALQQCRGDYMLLLNPDTLVERDTFSTCLAFAESHPDCGGLSVKMINGEGIFLKESKRGFPSPRTSFFKISGLIRLFPHNKNIGAYYMGHLNDNEIGQVDILPGAFLMISRQAFAKTGLLDESYFMYGEDIDWSWRIKLAGFENYYLPTARILHYKGECTKKGSMNYVYTFHNAMVIFAKKYFGSNGARRYVFILQLAVWLRATMEWAKRALAALWVPLLDFVVSLSGFIVIKQMWATYWASNVNYYPPFYTFVVLPLYVLVLLVATWLSGGYDKPVRPSRIVQGVALGALSLLVFYSLLSESLRFSRAIVLFGSLWSLLALLGIRSLLNLLKVKGYVRNPENRHRYLIIGSETESRRVVQLFDTLGIVPKSVTYADASIISSQLVSIVHRNKIDEVIFCSKDVSVKQMLDHITLFAGRKPFFRTAPVEMNALIGSNYTYSPDELYACNSHAIENATNRRRKRIFDIVVSSLLLLLSPILFWIQHRKRRFFADCLAVLLGKKSWVGYSQTYQTLPNDISDQHEWLPHIRDGVFHTHDSLPKVKNPDLAFLDKQYAHDYHLATDITIVMKNINKI